MELIYINLISWIGDACPLTAASFKTLIPPMKNPGPLSYFSTNKVYGPDDMIRLGDVFRSFIIYSDLT